MSIKMYFLFLLALSTNCYGWFFNTVAPAKPFILMLEASGDRSNSGRIIDDSFEYVINFEIAQALKEKLAQIKPELKIIFNRAPNELVAPLQNANFANKLDIDLYISIHSCLTNTPTKLYLYQFDYKEHVILKKSDLEFYAYDKIYLLNYAQTTAWAQKIYNFLHESNDNIMGVFKLPFKPLIGIKSPALAIEFCLGKKDDWKLYIDMLAQSIAQVMP